MVGVEKPYSNNTDTEGTIESVSIEKRTRTKPTVRAKEISILKRGFPVPMWLI